MAMPYFVFKGVDSTGIITVNKLPSIFKAERDMELIPVQGRDGYLTNDLGSYRSAVKSVECSINDLSRINYICNWLNGSGDVIFSNEPDKIYKAVIKNQIEFAKVLETFHSFIVLFECQPSKYLIENATITKTTSPATFESPPDVREGLPIIKVNGSGPISFILNETVVALTSVSSYETIDSLIGDCFKDIDNKNSDMTGDFPILVKGTNNLSWTSGQYQQERGIFTGTIGTAGNAVITIIAAGITGFTNPTSYNVPVLSGDTPTIVAGKAAAVLNADPIFSNAVDGYVASSVGTDMFITRKAYKSNDGTLNIAIANGTCTGLTARPLSGGTATGYAPLSSIEIIPNWRYL